MSLRFFIPFFETVEPLACIVNFMLLFRDTRTLREKVGVPENAIDMFPKRGMCNKIYQLPDSDTILKVGQVHRGEGEVI